MTMRKLSTKALVLDVIHRVADQLENDYGKGDGLAMECRDLIRRLLRREIKQQKAKAK